MMQLPNKLTHNVLFLKCHKFKLRHYESSV